MCRIDDALRGDGFFIAIESSCGMSIDEVREVCIDELLALGVNANSSVKIQEIENIPRTDTGKVRRKELSKLYINTTSVDKGPSVPDHEKSIVELYAEIFPGAKINPGDSFRSLGGDSLNYIQMLMLLETRFGFAPTDWDKMSIEQLEKIKRKNNSSLFCAHLPSWVW